MEKVDIAKLLLDCPEGMELDCAIYEDVTFLRVNMDDYEYYPIELKTRDGLQFKLTKYGQKSRRDDAKRVIFPKGKNTWQGFVPPPRQFKDGDIIFKGRYIAIFWYVKPNGLIYYHCWYDTIYGAIKLEKDFGIGNLHDKPMARLATEEEKQQLFDAIKANGCKWKDETKTFEKLIIPKFKVGDIIQDEDGQKVKITEVNIDGEFYSYESDMVKRLCILFSEQDEWKLVPNKFDINTIKPFDKVLGRTNDSGIWKCDLFSHYNDDELFIKFRCIGLNYRYCIPYKGNEHLLGTRNECDEYFKTWEE